MAGLWLRKTEIFPSIIKLPTLTVEVAREMRASYGARDNTFKRRGLAWGDAIQAQGIFEALRRDIPAGWRG